jgi:hypothetical protein
VLAAVLALVAVELHVPHVLALQLWRLGKWWNDDSRVRLAQSITKPAWNNVDARTSVIDCRAFGASVAEFAVIQFKEIVSKTPSLHAQDTATSAFAERKHDAKHVHDEILIAAPDVERRVTITKLASALENEFSGGRSCFYSKDHVHVARIGDKLARVRHLTFNDSRAVFVAPRTRARRRYRRRHALKRVARLFGLLMLF